MPDPAYNLRACHPGDEQALSLVACASLLEAFAGTLDGADILAHCRNTNSEARFGAWITAPGTSIALAELRQAPIGYAVLCPPEFQLPVDPAADIELRRIYLLHRFQALGIGAALLTWAVDHARALGRQRLLLGVYGGNDKAIAFYRRNGFEQVGTRRFLVGNTLHDDLVFARSL